MLAAGGILALRGLGGFHLAVDGTCESAVAELRRRKRREAKPLAVMVRTLTQARTLAEVSEEEASLLCSPERPVVLLRRHDSAGLAPAIAPGLGTVGVLLAYTPVHHLLLHFWIKVFGYGETSVRTPSAIAGVAGVLMTYVLVRRLMGRRVALIAALLVAGISTTASA